jgi:hypothetical protein
MHVAAMTAKDTAVGSPAIARPSERVARPPCVEWWILEAVLAWQRLFAWVIFCPEVIKYEGADFGCRKRVRVCGVGIPVSAGRRFPRSARGKEKKRQGIRRSETHF